MGLFKKLTDVTKQVGGEMVKSYKGAINYQSPKEIAEERSKRADKIRILVQCPGGSLEVYDDFIIGYPTENASLGIGLLQAAFGTQDTVFPMMIAGVTPSFKDPDSPGGNRRFLLTARMSGGKDQTIGFVVTPENEQAINNAYNYIIDFQQNPKTFDDDPALDSKPDTYTASAKSFPLLGQRLEISEGLDSYNYYQELYRGLAWSQAQKVKRAMDRRIISFETYCEFLSDIIYEYGLPLFELTLDICINNGIYSENEESIFKTHYSLAHNLEKCVNALDAYTQKRMGPKVAGARAGANMTYNPTTAVFGTNKLRLQEAALNARISNELNAVTAGLMANAFAHMTPQDKIVIYEKFDSERDDFVNAIYQDFWCMALTLNKIFANNGKATWSKTTISETEFRTIDNMARPDFPEEKIPEFILSLLQKNPYSRRIYSFLVDKYGKTGEISAIMEYFRVNEL